MFNVHCITKEDIKKHNPNWTQIPDHPYRILIVGGPGSVKKNALFNLINNQQDIDNIYLYAKDPYEAKNKLLINKREGAGIKYFNDYEAFIEYTNDKDDIYKNIEEYSQNKKRKTLIVFDDTITDMLSNKKLNPLVTELFIRGRKLNICRVFITQSYFVESKNIRLNSTHYFIMKISNKRELQQIALNHSSYVDFNNPLRFRKNLLERI